MNEHIPAVEKKIPKTLIFWGKCQHLELKIHKKPFCDEMWLKSHLWSKHYSRMWRIVVNYFKAVRNLRMPLFFTKRGQFSHIFHKSCY